MNWLLFKFFLRLLKIREDYISTDGSSRIFVVHFVLCYYVALSFLSYFLPKYEQGRLHTAVKTYALRCWHSYCNNTIYFPSILLKIKISIIQFKFLCQWYVKVDWVGFWMSTKNLNNFTELSWTNCRRWCAASKNELIERKRGFLLL